MRVQYITLNFFQTERSLRRYSFHLTFQSNDRLVYGVLTRAARGINNSKTLLKKIKEFKFFSRNLIQKTPHTKDAKKPNTEVT